MQRLTTVLLLVRCDSAEMPDNKCSNCIFFKTQCTHMYISKDSSSMLNYKNSREHVAAILSQTTAYVPSNDPAVLYQILVDIAKYARNLEELLAISSAASMNAVPGPSAITQKDKSPEVVEEADVSNDGVLVDSNITDPLRKLALRVPISGVDENYRFFGKSSTMNFIKEALEYAGDAYTFSAQRPEYWDTPVWQQQPTPEPMPPQVFPDDDLLHSLIDLYFQRINPLIFLLHAPSFRASVADGEHLRDNHFGSVVLVCLTDRLTDDPRVLITKDGPARSTGYKWFNQARSLKFATSPQASNFRWIHKLQLICLSVVFLAGTISARACWVLSGLGVRIAQEMGAHRRNRYNTGSRAEGEALKRTFWVLISMDTIVNSLFGRPTITNSEDYDTDMPTECDDEYWGEPYFFQQPAHKTPKQTAFMTSYLKLMSIFQHMQRALYGVKRQKEREPTIVAELDSALNSWVDSIPSHLRWDPDRQGIYLEQSTSLYVTYYHVQILIHRPFLPVPGQNRSANSTWPSLAICANSARSCGHVLDVHSRRMGDVLHQPHAITAAFDSAVVLLLNVWGGRRAKLLPSDMARAMADIKKCVDVLRLYEKQYTVAGRKVDIITEMLNRAGGNTPRSSNPLLKRPIPEDIENDRGERLSETTAAQQLEELELSIKQTDHLFLSAFSFGSHQTPSTPSTNSGTYSNGLAQSGYGLPGNDPQLFNADYSWYTGPEQSY
ncbi:Zn(2)-C6 fungal-type domain-containing protein [Mycena venus]|uniref:Zn(2)-C6 fungal-type domain-containing protein n=1 Tax=Mycena venus TaxID=2733690 RepID=A0A8H6XVP2_9AGAR|nr:Zn(2)-C6 fungal-type domain-containing protein [Mycena venus]